MGIFENFKGLIPSIKNFESFIEKSTKTIDMIKLKRKALEIAISEIGNGEKGANNSGDDVIRYRYGVDTKDAWCASFVSYCFKEASKDLKINLPFQISSGAKKLFKNISTAGFTTDYPLAGDVICWHRGKQGSWQGHIGFVEKVSHDGLIHTIEGNVGNYPAKVARFVHDIQYERLVGFASL